MKQLIFTLFFILFSGTATLAQSADDYFHQSAQLYTKSKDQYAKKLLDEGLMQYPNDPKLSALREKIKEDEEKKKKEQQKKDQQDQKDHQNKDQQKQDQDSQEKEQDKKGQDQSDQKDQEGKKSEEEKDAEQSDTDKKEGEESEQKSAEEAKDESDKKGEPKEPSTSAKLEAMNVSEEKAKQILEALRNKEAQYIQQMRKKATKRKDSGKPDW